jgi:hypothetical protein
MFSSLNNSNHLALISQRAATEVGIFLTWAIVRTTEGDQNAVIDLGGVLFSEEKSVVWRSWRRSMVMTES